MNTHWLGIPLLKNPLDLWIYQEIISTLMPDWIIESGTYQGGSALYLASICDLVKKGKVITIDIENSASCPRHDRIVYLKGSSTSKGIIEKIKNLINADNVVMVILDSCHEMAYVSSELRVFSEFVTKGSYLIVEDSNINGHPVYPDFGPGPLEAIKAFLQEHDDFIIDRSKEKYFLTFNPSGYLKRVS